MRLFLRIILLLFFSLTIVFAQTGPLSLEDCIQIALKNNSTIQINKNLNESADEDVLGSYAGILPTVNTSINVGKSRYGISENFRDVPVSYDSLNQRAIFERQLSVQPAWDRNFNNFDFQIRQNIFDGGEWWNAIRYGNSQKNASDYNLKSVINTAVLTVQQRFFDLLKQQKLLEVNELAVQRSQDQLNKTQKMFELGAVAKVDVYGSKVNLGNDNIQLLMQKNSLIQAKSNLNLAMGRNPNELIEIKPEFSLKPGYTNNENLMNEAINNNPGLKKAECDFNSNDIMISRAYSVLYPQLGAFFNYGRSNEELDRVYSGYNKNWNISYGLSVSLNIFNGFQDKVRIQKSKLASRNALETLEESKRNLKASILQLTDNINSYLEIIEINKENLEASKEEYRLAEERYRIGSGTQLELREAQVRLTRAEQTLVYAQYDARILQAQLEQQLGTIYDYNIGDE